MTKSYHQLMNQITVTDEMRKRILDNIEATDLDTAPEEQPKKAVHWQRYAAIAASLVVIVSAVLTFANRNMVPVVEPVPNTVTQEAVVEDTTVAKTTAPATDKASGKITSPATTQRATTTSGTTANSDDAAVYSPAETYDSLDALSTAAGFSVSAPTKLPFAVTETAYLLNDGALAEVDYYGTGENTAAYFRMSKGAEDNSGDYNEYTEEQTAQLGQKTITLKGNDGKYNLAIWQDDEYSYSLTFTEGVSRTAMLFTISSMQ